MAEFVDRLKKAVTSMQVDGPCDLLLYNGPIERDGFREVAAKAIPSSETVVLVLTTSGGDPHAAYRISRLLGDRYKKFVALIGAPCKSAGTLMVTGADEVVIAETGELGPLDIQLRRPDEPLEAESGLDVLTSLQHLTASALIAWDEAFGGIQVASELSTKVCADLASGLVSELFGKLFAQVDPVRLGAVVRANTIATRYGLQLSETRNNLKTHAVTKLVTSYPAHGYVIDFREAKTIFNRVRQPNDAEQDLLNAFDDAIRTIRRTEKERLIWRLDGLLKQDQDDDKDADEDKDRPEATRADASPTKDGGRDDATNGSGPVAHQPSSSITSLSGHIPNR
jgi:hypothetical protein